MSGCNSGGADPEGPEKREPPRRGFLLEDLVLSSSEKVRYQESTRFRSVFTFNAGLDRLLNRQLEDLSLSPYFHNSAQFVLYFTRRPFVGRSNSICNYLEHRQPIDSDTQTKAQ